MLAEVITEASTITLGLAAAVGALVVAAATAFALVKLRVDALEKKVDAALGDLGTLMAWKHRSDGAAEAVRRKDTSPYDLPRD